MKICMTALSAAVALTISATAGAVEKPDWVEGKDFQSIAQNPTSVVGEVSTGGAYINDKFNGNASNGVGVYSTNNDALNSSAELWIKSNNKGNKIFAIRSAGATGSVVNSGRIYAEYTGDAGSATYARAMLADGGASVKNEGLIYVRNNGASAMQTTNTDNNKLVNAETGVIVVENGAVGITMDGGSKWGDGNKNKNSTAENRGTIFIDDKSTAFKANDLAGATGIVFTNSGDILGNGTAFDTNSAVLVGSTNITINLEEGSHVEGKFKLTDDVVLDAALNNSNGQAETLKIEGSTKEIKLTGSNVVIEHVGSDILALGSVSVDGASSLNFRMNSLGQQLSGTVTGEGRNGVGVVYSGDVSDELLSAPADAEKLFTNISGLTIDGEALTSVYAEEGLESDASVFVKGENGEVVQNVVGTNSLMSSAQDVAVASALMWRDQLSTLSDRMGTLRTLPSQYGSWARFTNGRLEGDTVEHDFNTLEVGFDAKVTDSFGLGASFSYTKGDSDVAAGQADNNTYTAGVYATYVNDSNCYLDAMFKLGRIDADYDLVNGAGREKADYMMTGAILGVEAGHRWNIDSFYVEPQVQVVYSHLREAGFDSNVRHVEFDVIESFITRVGVTGGMKFGEKGAAYVGLSYNHDFMGDVEGTYTRNNTRVIKTELDDNWGEARIGASYEVMNGLSAFADAAATFGGDIDQKWRFNVGARYVF